MRGFWTGFARSFYYDRKKEVSSRCFSNNLASELFFVVNFMEGRESIMQTVKFVTTASRILNDNLNYCGYTEAIERIEKHCKISSTICTPQKLFQNVSSNIFSLFGDLQGIAAVMR